MTTPEPPKRHLPSHVFNIVVLVVGGVVLAVMMERLGWDNARDVVRSVGAWAGVIFALDLAGVALDAAAIHAFMRPEARMVGYPQVVAATLSGRAINALVPGGALGETVKITMLVAHAPRERVISSIVLSNLWSFYLSVATVIVGVPFTLIAVDLPHDLEVVVIVGLGVLVPLVVGLGWVIHRGALQTLVGRFTPRWQDKLAAIDRHLRELHADRSPGTRLGMLYVAASRVASWTALAVLLHAIGVTLSATLMIGVLSVGVLIGWVSTFVPFGVGVADAGNYLLYDVLGASGAHGVFVTMLGRARAIALALLGLAVMAAGHVATRITVARRRRHFAELRARMLATLVVIFLGACADPGQHEITAPGDLLAADGSLREPGWAPRQLLRWNPENVADPSALRQWDFVAIQSADVAINLTLTDLSFLRVATVGTVDLHTGATHTALAIANASDTFVLSDDLDGSAGATIGGAPVLAFTPTTLTIDLPASALGEAATGSFTLGPRPAAYLSLATPFDDSPTHFFFEQKVPGIAASGSLTIGGVTYDVAAANATIDWGRGAWPSTATWRWAAAAGTVGGQPVAFNLGMGFGDASAGSENIAFVDDAVTKLDRVDWTYTAGDPGADWHFDGDGVSLTLHPGAREIGGLDFGNVYSHVRKGYGTFTGTIAGVSVDGLRGFAEREDLSW